MFGEMLMGVGQKNNNDNPPPEAEPSHGGLEIIIGVRPES